MFRLFLYLWVMSKKIPVEAIPFEAKINLVIPGTFYARIQQLLLYFSNTRPPEELVKAMNLLKEQKEAETDFEYHVHTLTILVHDIERKAKEQGLMVNKEIEVDEEGTAKGISES
jgi:hypothetical protein